MNRRFLLRGLAGMVLLTALPGARLGRSYRSSRSRGSSRRGAAAPPVPRYGGGSSGARDAVREREYFDSVKGDSRRQLRQMEMQDKWRARSVDRDMIRRERDATRRAGSVPTNRLGDRLRPSVKPLGNVGGSEARLRRHQTDLRTLDSAPRTNAFPHIDRSTR